VQPDKSGKYARPERERRFLLRQQPPGLVDRAVAIHDRYLDGTRLRLRRTTESAGDEVRVVFKLTQKMPPPAPGGTLLLTTMYLSADEHARLAAIPALVVEKTRFHVGELGVDVFAGALAGLVLAEVEFDDAIAMARYAAPPFAVAEVTEDPRFSGGQLARTPRLELSALLRPFGITLHA
jgi:CYTH domain-containing protein